MPSRTTLPRPAPGTAKWWVIGTLGVAAGVAVAVWFGIASTGGARELDDDRLQGARRPVRPGDVPAEPAGRRDDTCTIQALARDFATVGSLDVAYPAAPAGSGARRRPRRSPLRTTSRAVTGEVKTCS